MRLARIMVLAGLVGLVGCAARNPAVLAVSHTLSGAASADRALIVEIEGCEVDRPLSGEPLASRSTLIVGPSNEPLAASPSPGERVLLAPEGSDLPAPGYSAVHGSVAALEAQRVVVPQGCVAAMTLSPAPSGGRTGPPVLELRIGVTADARPEFSLLSRRIATEEESLSRVPRLTDLQALRADWPIATSQGQFMLAVPAAPELGLPRAVLLRFRAREAMAGDPGADEARALLDSLRAAPAAAPARWSSLARSLREAKGAARVRAALAFAAMDVGSDLGAEAAALADDEGTAALASAVADALAQTPPEAPPALAGWTVDRATILALARKHAANALPRGMRAMLSARFGEVGRDTAGLAALAGKSGSRAEFGARLEAEHLVLLDDASPALRVRSYDWLAARGAAPAGYDPLGPARDRRAAVDQHLQRAEKQP